MKFQIREVDKRGCGSFYYFDSDTIEEAKTEACRIMTKETHKRRKLALNSPFSDFIPMKIITVVEYDAIKHRKKKGGLVFEIGYGHLKVNGLLVREWYSAL